MTKTPQVDALIEVIKGQADDVFLSAYPSDRVRVPRTSGGETVGLARSLPLTVPFHKHKLLQKNDDQVTSASRLDQSSIV